MNHTSVFRLVLFVFIIQFNTVHSLLSTEIELFSLSYGDDGLKVNILYQPTYDEAVIKKEAEEMEFYKQELQQHPQKIKEIEESIKRTEESIKIKQAALQKAFMEPKC